MQILRFFLIFNIFLIVNLGFSSAQERGTPNLDAHEATEKAAKNGDKTAMLKIADICVGKFYDFNSVKDYKMADKWYQKILHTQDTLNKYAYFNLFKINLIGAFGLKEQNLEKARTYLNLHAEHFPTTLTYDNDLDLDLKNFLSLYEKQNNLDGKELLTLARYFHEFNISYAKALDYIDKAASKGNPNAAYYKVKWIMMRDYFRSREKSRIPIETEKQAFEELAKSKLENTPQARLEFVHLMMSPDHTKINLKPQRIDELLLPLLDSANDEMKFKILATLFLCKKDVEKLETMQKMAACNVPKEIRSRQFATQAMKLYADFSANCQTVSGVFEFLKGFGNIPSIKPIKLTDYRRNYNGQLMPLHDLVLQFNKAENRKLFGEKFTEKYFAEINTKFETNINAQTNAFPLVKLYNLWEIESSFQKIYPNLGQKIRQKLGSLNLTAEDTLMYLEKIKIDKQTFKSFEEGHIVFNRLQKEFAPQGNKNAPVAKLKQENLAQLLLFLKTKVVHDLYGQNPSVAQIEQIKTAVHRNKWLLPEGEDIYWAYTQDSENWFTGKILMQGVAYHYVVMHKGNDYSLEIKSIKDAQSNLLYRSKITVFDYLEKDEEVITVNLHKAKYEKYKWNPSEMDYLQVHYKQNSPIITVSTKGNLSAGNAAAFSEEMLFGKEEPADFTHKTAIRTAMKYFILAYHQTLGM